MKLNPFGTSGDAATSNLVQQEPVLVGAFVMWLLTNLGAILVGREHWLTSATWSPLASALAPIITAAIIGGIGLVVRRYVSPFIHKLEADVPFMAQVVDDYVVPMLDQAVQELENAFESRPRPLPAGAPEPAAPHLGSHRAD